MRAECPQCGKQYKISSDLAGKKVRCSQCNQIFSVGELDPLQPLAGAVDDMPLPPTETQSPLRPRRSPAPPEVAPAQVPQGAPRADTGHSLGQLILPTKNPVSIFAYYLGVGSLICVPILGLPAMVCGLIGLIKCISRKQTTGLAHSLSGIFLPFVGAGLIFLCWWWIENGNRF